MCNFGLVFFSPFSIAITSLGKRELILLRLPRLGKRELILVLFVRLFDLCLFGFVGFLFLLGYCDCGTLWTFLLPFFFFVMVIILSSFLFLLLPREDCAS